MSRVGRSILLGALGALAALVATEARAQKVLLELRPHTGDTLRMQLEQVTEMSGARPGEAPALATTTLRMYSRAIVESTAHIASLILAITDSVDVSSTDAHGLALGEQAKRELTGRQMRLRLWPDGSVTLNDGAASVPREVNELVSVMPGSFPSRPVGVGETWIREMPIPPGTALGIPAGSVVRTRFRLDSLSSDGDLAFVAMSGALEPMPAVADVADAAVVDGTVSGHFVVDRKRGWLSESHFRLQLRSTLARKAVSKGVAKGDSKDDSMRFRVRMTQSMKVLRPSATPRLPR
jgi:hypothetical protein